LTGHAVGQEVKSMLTAVKHVYLTLNPDFGVCAEAFRRGAVAYLQKAISPAQQTVANPQRTYADLAAMGDDELMLSLRAGCNDALAVLVGRYHRLVYSIVLRIVRDRQEAEDVMQNVFLDIFRAVERFDPAKGSTKVWLLGYAYHRAINRRRHLISRKFYQQESIEETDYTRFSNSWFIGYTRCELRMLLEQGLSTLRAKEKRVIELVSFEGFSMKEVAEKTGETLVNVRHRYYRGLQKLRKFVERSPQPDELRPAIPFNKSGAADSKTTGTNQLAA
jgi:RNA polymerase sigma-70 factor, ECF subfamily